MSQSNTPSETKYPTKVTMI